jgi:hypothetical protein
MEQRYRVLAVTNPIVLELRPRKLGVK